MDFNFSPIATVSNNRIGLEDDDWGDVISEITLVDELSPDLLLGLAEFSHVEIIFVFNLKRFDKPLPPTRHPRNKSDWPKLGLLSQRSVHHPNPIGHTSARIIKVTGPVLTVQGLDAVNGTPVLDIKPVFKEFLPENPKQPSWVSELLRDYWFKQ